jgi:excisionase family DNA binding protein
VVHRTGCSFSNGGTGLRGGTRADNGGWHGPYASLAHAEATAQETGGTVRFCKVCRPAHSIASRVSPALQQASQPWRGLLWSAANGMKGWKQVQPLATTQEVADYLRVEPAMIERLVREGQLGAYCVGDEYRFVWEAVEAYLAAHTTQPDAAWVRRATTVSAARGSGPAAPRTKYWRIANLLAAEREPRIAYSFAKLEQEIGEELPRSARLHRAWWANTTTSHPHAQSWLSRGWRVAGVNLDEETVTFERSDSGST